MSADELKGKGNAAFSKGDYEEAINFFTAAIQIDPNSHVLYSNRSAAYASQKKYTDALKDADRCIEIKPDWAKGYSRKGAALHFLGKLDEAVATYTQGLKLEPENAQIKQALEEVQKAKFQRSEEGNANNMFANAFSGDVLGKLRANPDTSKYLAHPDFVKAILEIQQNPANFQKYTGDQRIMMALGVLLGIPISTTSDMEVESTPPPKAEEKKPVPKPEPKKEPEPELPDDKKKAEEQKNIGNEFYKKKEFDKAIDHYNKALEFDPNNIVYITNRAAALYEKGDFNGCLKDCQLAVEEGRKQRADYKNIAKAFSRMGNAYMKLDKLDDAVEAYNKSLTEDRTPQTLALLKKAEKIKEERDRLAKIDPQRALEHKEKGNKLFQEGQIPEAIKEYTEAIDRNPSDHVPFSNRAACYMKLAEYRLAIKDADECIKLKPDFVKGWIRKAHSHYFVKEYEKALEAYDKGMQLEPNNQEMTDGVQRTLNAMTASRQQAPDKESLERAMADPEVQTILSDPVMRQILQDMQNDPKAAADHLKNPAIAAKIQKLVNAGVLRVA